MIQLKARPMNTLVIETRGTVRRSLPMGALHMTPKARSGMKMLRTIDEITFRTSCAGSDPGILRYTTPQNIAKPIRRKISVIKANNYVKWLLTLYLDV
jgi:hypothetical protein